MWTLERTLVKTHQKFGPKYSCQFSIMFKPQHSKLIYNSCFQVLPDISSMFGLFPSEAISHNSTVLSGHCCHYSHLIKSLWHKWPAALICYPPCCIDCPSHKRLFEGCWSPIYICNTFVLIKCSHSMEIGYLTKWLEPAVIRLIAVTVAASVPYRSIFRVAGYWILKSESSDQITWWNLMTSHFIQWSKGNLHRHTHTHIKQKLKKHT